MGFGQIAIEYLTLMGIGLVMLTIFLVIAGDRLTDLNKDALAIEAQDVAYMIQSEIVNAATVEDGFERNFTTPLKLTKSEYTVNITYNNNTQHTTLILDAGTVHIAMSLPNATGNITKGVNRLYKRNERVYINVNP